MIISQIKEKIHGVVSLSFLGIAIIIAFLVILLNDLNFAILYFFILSAAPFAICYFYCMKCPCKNKDCSHVFPGKLTRLFKKKQNAKNYKFIDYFITISILLLLIGIPQYWLIKNSVLFAIFWALIIIAVFEAKLFVCTACQNKFCPVSKAYKFK